MALDLSRIKAICFDVDGTLSDTDDLWIRVLEERLKPFRHLFPEGNVRPFVRWLVMESESPGNYAYQVLDRMHLDATVGRLYHLLTRRRRARKPPTYWIIDGVQEMVRLLSLHYPLAIVSARDQAGTEAFLEQFKMREHFMAVATAMTCRYTKPFPDPVIWAARQMGVSPEHCLMVGDTVVDILAGKAAGAQTAGVLCGFGEAKELRRAGANIILPQTSMLVEILFPTSGEPLAGGE
jgi:phosphoglycolate phosphatase-like HAD superfamily hydrolase